MKTSRPHLHSRIALLVAVVVQVALAPLPAHAQSGPLPPLARALHGPAKDAYEASKILLVNSDFKGALTKLQQAYDLSKDPRLLYNMALCNKNLHAYARMETLLLQYEREAGDSMTRGERMALDSALAAISGVVGAFKVTLTPEGATLLVDGEPVGTSPLKDPVLVDLGKHTLSARMQGFDTIDKPVDVSGGNIVDLAFALTPSKPMGSITIAADDGATVTLDGTVVGSGRFHDKVAVGQHSVKVTAPGKLPFDTEVDVRDGENRTLDVALQAPTHAAVWPWLVGAGAVVVVGGAVGGYFLLSPSTTVVPAPTGKLGGVQFSSVALGRGVR